jgi:AraC-like DNA-binding protein
MLKTFMGDSVLPVGQTSRHHRKPTAAGTAQTLTDYGHLLTKWSTMPVKDQISRWRVPVAYLKLFLQHAESQGLPLTAVLAGTGLDAAALGQSDQPVDFAQTRRVLANVTRLLEPGWHLELGQKLTIPYHGPLGFAVVTAPDLRAAVNVLLRFIATRGAWVWLAGAEEGDDYVIRVYESLEMGAERAALVELALLAVQNMIERPLGRRIRGARIVFAMPEPGYVAQLRAVFHADVEFGAAGHLLRFPAAWLAEPCFLHDAAMHRYLIARCEEDLRAAAGILPAEAAVRQALLANPGQLPGLAEIAASQHVSPRTLIRRLKKGGTSYREILESVRCTLAVDYLLNSDHSVARIAFRLAYQDPSNFGRAFRAWFGTSPGRFRARARGEQTR